MTWTREDAHTERSERSPRAVAHHSPNNDRPVRPKSRFVRECLFVGSGTRQLVPEAADDLLAFHL